MYKNIFSGYSRAIARTGNSIFFLIIVMLLFSSQKTYAQTPGLIYLPSTGSGRAVLDPNGDGYTSATTAGFQGGIDYGAQSELKMVAVPVVTPEPTADLSTGGAGGQTDIVGNGNSVYVLNDGNGNFIIRFRIGKNSSASKGYTLLIDLNGKFGPSDPNYTTTNMGFEKEVTLETNFGVVVNDLVTNTSTTYDLNSHQQRSVAATSYSGDPDYFYDFYVPISAITSTPATTQLRFAATTVTSAQSGTTGTISDINGINDQAYGGNTIAALTTAINSFPPTTITGMTAGSSFPAILSTAPVITRSIAANSSSISGTSIEADGTTITIYRKVSSGSYTQVGTTTVTGGSWSWTISGLSPALTAGDLVEATATASGKSESPASNIITVTAAQTCYLAAPVPGTRTNGSNSNSVAGTWTWPTGVTPTANTAVVHAYYQTAGTSTFTELTPASAVYVGTDGTFLFTVNISQNTFNGYAIYFTVAYNGCTSGYSTPSVKSLTITTAPQITTASATTATTSITVKNLNTSSADLTLYINGIAQSPVATSIAANGTNTFTVAALNIGDVIAARAQASGGYLSGPSNLLTVATASTSQSVAPVITGHYYSGGTTVSGTSVEQSGSTILLYKAGTTLIGTTTVNNYGNWTTTGLSLATGDVLTATVTALGKTVSSASNSVTVLATASAPTAPTVTGPIQAGATSISGTGGAGMVTVYVDGEVLGTVTSASGAWTLFGIGSTEIYKAASINATNTNTTTFLSSTSSNTVVATGADHFLVEANGGGNIPTQTAGVPFSIQITAENSSNTVFNTYTGTNVVSSGSTVTAGQGPTNAFSAGTLTGYSVTLTTAGTYTLTTVSTVDPTITGTSNTFAIKPGPASSMAVHIQPSATIGSEVYFTQQPVIYLYDQYGNPATTDNTTKITAFIASGSGVLNGQLTVTAVNGVATFSGLSITGAGSDVLSFAASGVTGVQSNAIIVTANTPAAPTALSYTTPHTYLVNSAITALAPTITGVVTTYAISPALPAGLSLNTATGVITGTPTVTAAQATYTVTASNSSGSISFGISLTVNPLLSLAISSQTNVFVYGASTGSVTVTATGGISPYQYQIVSGALQNSPTFSGLPAGTYTLTVTDASSVTASVPVTITQPSSVLALTKTSQTDVTSYGASTGSITVAASGGTAPYQYQIGSGSLQSSPTFNGLAAGTYTVEVSDGNGVTSTVSVTITQPAAPAALCSSGPSSFGYEYISSVTINGATVQGATGLSGPGYFDYTGSSLTTMIAGKTYNVSVAMNANSGDAEYVRMWIDFNGNGNLNDSGELVLDQNTNSGNYVFSGTITIPTNAHQGAVYIRIVHQYNVAPSICGTYDYGTTIDCMATITGGSTLTVATSGTGSVTSNPSGINTAASTSSAVFAQGSNVTLTATPSGSASFIGWTGDVISTSNPLTLTMDADKNITAVFATGPVLTTTAAGSITSTTATSGGNVTSDGGSAITARGTCWNTTGSPTIGDSNTSDGSSTGTFTSSLTGLSPNTTYHVRAYATNAVSTSYGNEITFTTTLPLALAISSQTNVFAFGASTGSVTVSATGGTAPYQYQIGSGAQQSSPTFSSLAAGTYTLTVTDANSITSTTSVTINQPASVIALTVSSQTDVFAFGASTGSVTVAATGGIAPYQYQIGSGAQQSSPTFSGLAAGNYTLTVTDANSITSTTSVTINQPSAALALSVSSQTNVTAFGASTGAVTVAATGGTAPYQYQIGSGAQQSSPTFSGLAAGTYTITASDVNNITATTQVTINQPASALALTVSSQTNVFAFGASTGSVTVSATGGTAPYQYQIGSGAQQSSPTFSSLAAGTYALTVTDANSITSTTSVTINQPASVLALTVSSQTDVFAFGASTGSVTVAATGGIAPYQYQIGSGAQQSSPTFSGLAAGNYTLTVTDANSITSTTSVTINQPSAALALSVSSQTNVTAFGASTGAVTVAATGGTAPYQYQIGSGAQQSSPTFSGLAASTYTITVTDASSATATTSVTITQPGSALSLAVSSTTNVTVFGTSTGSVTVAATGGTTPYQYQIGSGSLQSSPTFSGLAAGTYTITVTDANSATATTSVTITQPAAALALSVNSQTNVAIFGASTGAVTVAATGGTAPYQYQIGSGSLQSSPTFSGLAANTYTITVTDANSATATTSVTITEPGSALSLAVSSQTNVAIFGASTGAVTLAATGGTTPYQYQIGSGSLQSSPTFSGLAAGTYTITVTDANSATATTSVTITQPGSALSLAISSTTNVTVFGTSTGSVTVAATGGATPYQYQIGSGSLQSSPTFSGLAAGTYTITVTDASSATATTSVTITQPAAALALSVNSQTNVAIFGASTGAVTVAATGGTAPYQYQIGSGSLQSSPTFSGLAVGTYTITVTDANSATATTSVTITEPGSALSLAVSSQTNIAVFGASTGAVTVAATGGTAPYQYQIGSGSLQSSPTFSGLAAGTYTITVTDARSATATTSVTITQAASALSLAVSSQTNVAVFGASTGSVTVAATGGTAPYQYQIGSGSLQSSPTFSGLAAGTYTITVTDASSATATTSVTITQPAAALALSVSAQSNVSVFGASTGSVTVAATGGTAPYQYQIGGGAQQSSPTFSGLTAGAYTITVSDVNNITANTQVTITQPGSALSLAVSSQTNVAIFGASTGAVTVAATGGTAPYQYQIGSGSLQMSPTFSGLAAGTYTIIVTDANSATATTSVTITQPAATSTTITFNLPAKTYGDSDFAPGASTNNPAMPITYTSDNTSVATIVNGKIHIVGAGIVNITASQPGDNSHLPQSSTQQLKIAKALLTVTADDQSRPYGAKNSTLTVKYSGFINGDDSYALATKPAANTEANASTLPGNYPITISGGTADDYYFNYVPGTLTITPLANADVITLEINPGTLSPAFSAGISNYSAFVGYSTNTLLVMTTFDRTASATLNGAVVTNGSYNNIPLSTGNNILTLVITAQDGITQKTYVITIYKAAPPAEITATNILTPNGNGKNDTWVIKDIELYPKNKVTIFDRAGRLLYTKNGYTNDWDGTIDGKPLVQGTYYYIVELAPDVPPVKGFITILTR